MAKKHCNGIGDFLAFARTHPLYRERFAGVPVGAPLSAYPLTDKKSLYGEAGRRWLLAQSLERSLVFRTGGSSGEPKFSVFSTEEFSAVAELLAFCYAQAGLTAKDRFSNVFVGGGLYASFLYVTHALLNHVGCTVLPHESRCPPEQLVRDFELFGVTAVGGIVSTLLALERHCRERGLQLRLPKIFYAGEHLFRKHRQALKETFGAALIASAGYAAVDVGVIGYQCPHCEGAVHHVFNRACVVELLPEESLAQSSPPAPIPLDDGEAVGEIAVTSLTRRLQPIIRYRVGDLGRWLPGPCPCGDTSPRLALLGRAGESLRLSYSTIVYDELQRPLSELAGLSPDVQLVASIEDGKDLLSIRAERDVTEASLAADAPLADAIRNTTRAAKPDLAALIDRGLLGKIRVEVLAPGSLERSAHSGKLVRVIDRREY